MRLPTQVVGRRIAAYLIDAALLTAISIVAFVLVADRVPPDVYDALDTSGTHLNLDLGDTHYALTGSGASTFFAATVLLWMGYFAVLQGRFGRTLGKRLLGLRVVREDGSAPGFGRALVRSLLFVIDGFPYFIPNLVGLIVAASTPRNQRLGDLAAQTFVVRDGEQPAHKTLAADAPPAAGPAGWYADPRGEQRLRWWDGESWTAHTAP